MLIKEMAYNMLYKSILNNEWVIERQSSVSELWNAIYLNNFSLEYDWSWISCLIGSKNIYSVFNNLSHGHFVGI